MITVEKFKKFLKLEFAIGVIGAVLGLQEGFYVLSSVGIDGFSAILASIIGLIGAVCVNLNAKIGGIILIISSIWLLISIPTSYGIFGAALLGVAGILAIVENDKPSSKQPS